MLWDIFCKVIDNYGDIGVCWRLSADLAARGERVRLWVDDASALPWMAPQGCPGVEVRPWTAGPLDTEPGDAVIEAFGCELAPDFVAAMAQRTRASGRSLPWINLEYLSAEAYVERSHGLPSPVLSGPGAGLTKHFFYPGFTARTGGLLREPGLLERQARFDRAAWLQPLGRPAAAEQLVSLFCYEPAALGAWLAALAAGRQPVRLLVTPGRAAQAVQAVFSSKNASMSLSGGHGVLSISYLPAFSQTDFDALLWACDLNFVRGEDSLVRALWAGRPFIWHIYPQHDDAHRAKLEAFLAWLDAPASLRQFHRVWNGLGSGPLPACDLPAWGACVQAARQRLLAQDDLTTQLLRFAAKTR
ncbi:elongation factor P maturation arginine rhamnosyltransferase EarP [Variovorax terrae]|uniref:Protein-arginine rhamnosyltransferase n=1 Tax=Variovorax terrae TaxID=2923278 RepID=A0A9X2ANJ5_9BURK|nr:elongation factor P maturation arginine rhamnosyltransferase EarP [Variovorax terrae]MCJ0763820.1 elongation factor P maturation arginine rhamnosyltransferase EarP [Variovorax terrae]